MATVRPRMPFLRIPSASCAACFASTASSSAWSAMSRSNVDLVGARLRGAALGLDDVGAVEVHAPVQVVPVAAAEAAREVLGIGLLDRADRREAERGEALDGLGPEAGDDPRRGARQPPARLLAAHGHEPARLLEVRGDLRDQPVRADADRDRDPRARLDLRDELAQHAQRLLALRDVGVALVEPDLAHDRQPRAHELPDLARLRLVGLEVGREEDGVRAQAPRLGGRRGRADAVLAGLVGRGRDHRARPAAGHDDGLADEVRPPQQLDGHVERVAVEMGDHAAAHDPRLSRAGRTDPAGNASRGADARATSSRPRPARAPRGCARRPRAASSSAPWISTSGCSGASYGAETPVKSSQLARARPGVEALRVARLAHLERRVDVDLEELQPGRLVQLPRQRAVVAGGGDERGDRHHARVGHEPREVRDAADVLRPVGRRERQVARDAVAQVVAVEEVRGVAVDSRASARAPRRCSTCPRRAGR